MMHASSPRISVVINTLNEERNLPAALRSVAWADEVVVVDMHSDDRTAAIARDHGARVFLHPRAGFADPARAYAIGKATSEWILILDADELIPPPLAARLRAAAEADRADVVMIPREEYMLGALIRHAWRPEGNKHPRFFRRGAVTIGGAIHDFIRPVPGARIAELPYRRGEAMVHFAYLDMAHFLEKIDTYSTVEAEQSVARGPGQPPAWVLRDLALFPRLRAFFRRRRATPLWAVVYAALVFVRRYLINGGFRDGWRGFYLSLFWAGYFFACYAKLAQLERVGARAAIREQYDAEAERILAGYDPPSRRADERDPGAPRISVVINTLNEERNLPAALRSVAWADEVVVVDMHSDDRTAAIARDHGARVFNYERMGFSEPARAYAIGKATGEWILILDADELITPDLHRACLHVIAAGGSDGIDFPRLNYWLGAPLLHTGMGPDQDKLMRFFRRSSVQASGAIHDFLSVDPDACIRNLAYRPGRALVHFAYTDFAHVLDKFNRYSTIEAEQGAGRIRGEPPAWVARELRSYPRLLAPFRERTLSTRAAALYALLTFVSRYVKNRGYRDGWRGFYISVFFAWYHTASYAKLTEIERGERRAAARQTYDAVTERVLAGYGDSPRVMRDG